MPAVRELARLDRSRHSRLLLLIPLCASFVALVPAAAGEPEIVSVAKIWDDAPHSAFTDLIRTGDRFLCVFREAEDHVGGDGRIRVLTSGDGEQWTSAALVSEAGVDLRDPKISILPDGRYMLLCGGSIYGGTRTLQGRQPRVAFSADAATWTPLERILSEGDWLWRVTWHSDTGYGVAYRVSPRPDSPPDSPYLATLYSTRDGVEYQLLGDMEVPDRAGETTLRFMPDGEMMALVRRELGTKNGWIGSSRPPYKNWRWYEIEHRLGGPNFLRLPNGDLWAGSRSYPGGPKTILARMTPTSYAPVLTLPSGGDTSYPGLVWHDGLLWMSYYSSHEGKAAVYLAKIRFND